MLAFGARPPKNNSLQRRLVQWSVKTLRWQRAPWAHHRRLINPDWRQQMTDKKTVTSRRGMLKGAAVAAGAMSVPMIATAQTTTLRFQSTWPATA